MSFKMKGSPYKNVGYTKYGPKSVAFQKAENEIWMDSQEAVNKAIKEKTYKKRADKTYNFRWKDKSGEVGHKRFTEH